MPASGITFSLLDGAEATARAAEVQALHAEVPCEDGDDARFARRWRVQCRQPGFALAEASHGGYLVGYAAGLPLRPSTSWWRNLTTPLSEEVTAEPAGRTFAVADLLVRASWRRQGIGQALHGMLLAGRAEERATVIVPPGANAAQHAFQSWGWRKVARTRDPDPAAPVSDILLLPLPVTS